MGWANCRFLEDEGCKEIGSQEWHIYLSDLNRKINLPSMWKHYMTQHLVQPTPEEREVIMSADPEKATGKLITTRGGTVEELKVLYVERLGPNTYTHQIGIKEDWEFINQLEKIIGYIQPLQTKGIDTRPGYR